MGVFMMTAAFNGAVWGTWSKKMHGWWWCIAHEHARMRSIDWPIKVAKEV